MNDLFLFHCEGPVEREATELWEAIRGPGDITAAEVQPRPASPGAALGAGTIIVTILFTEAVKRIVKLGLDRLERYLSRKWNSTDSNHRFRVQIIVENTKTRRSTQFVIEDDDEVSAVERTMTKIQASIG